MTRSSTDWSRWVLAGCHQTHGACVDGVPERLGQWVLSESQRHAAVQLMTMIQTYHGAMLADAVGTGKTRVALAVAHLWRAQQMHLHGMGKPVVCCVPSRLMERWRVGARQAGLTPGRDVILISHAKMSRQFDPDTLSEAGLVIVDEAHHMRNPKAKRTQALAQLALQHPVLLVTATPICNDLWDLYHLLRLFLSDDDFRSSHGVLLHHAFEHGVERQLDLISVLGQCVVRATERIVGSLRPDVCLEQLTYQTDADEHWMWSNLERELRQLNWRLLASQWPMGLCREYLLQAWESGANALGDALDMLIDYHLRWLEGARKGVDLSRDAHRMHFDQRQRQQNVLPFVWSSLHSGEVNDALVRDVMQDLALLERLQQRLRALNHQGRLDSVVRWMRGEPRQKVLIFSRFEATAKEAFEHIVRELGGRAQVGLLTGRQSMATGLGRTTADDILRRFAPCSQGLKPPPKHQSLRILIATDCLAEGINLQDCGCVVMLDLPYSPLGVEQRVGRLVRPGGPHLKVRVMVPRPADWNDSLGLRHRLQRKGQMATRVGMGLPLTQALFEPHHQHQLADRPLDARDAFFQLCAAQIHQKPQPMPGWWVSEGAQTVGFLACAKVTWAYGEQVVWSFWRPGDEVVEHRLGVILPFLIHLMDAQKALQQAPWPVAVMNQMEQSMNDMCARRRAVSMAPASIERGQSVDVLWRQMVERTQESSATWQRWSPRLRAIRARMCRAHPRGVDEALDLWLAHHPDWQMDDLFGWLDRMLPHRTILSPQQSMDLRWQWVGGVWIRA